MTRLLLIWAVRRQNEWSYVPRPALGLGYIASYLRKYHDPINITIIERSYEYDINDLVKKYKPDIVGISSTTQEYSAAIMIAEKVKEIDNNILVVIGGHHITALPKHLTRNMDIGILGEGEETFDEVIRQYENNNLCEPDKILGIVYWKNGNITDTKRRDLIRPIDKIPFPARDLLEIEKITHMMTSRGCPYQCIYCSSSSFWGSYRFHSPEYVIGEIKELVYKYKVKEIQIEDDLFIANRKRVERISKLIQDEGISENVTFQCLCRANLLNEDIMKCLKSMNVQNICIGTETGSERILCTIKMGSVTIQQNIDALKLAKRYGIRTHGFFMIGAPDESKEDMLETYKFIKENSMDSGQISVMVPYPGTEIWNYAKGKNLVSEDMNWDIFDMDFIKNNKEYIIINDVVSREDMIDIFLKIKREIEQKRSFYLRNRDRLISIYRGDVKPLYAQLTRSLY